MRKSRRFFYLIVLVIFAALVQAAQSEAVGEQKKTIKIVGSSTVLPIATRSAEKFKKIHTDITITISPGGSGVGVKSTGNHLADIGMISREITSKEKRNFPNVDFMVYVIGRDAVACVISSEIYNSGVKTLSKEEMQKIYQGEIDNWKDVGGPDKEIFVIDKEFHRGTRHVFMAYVFDDKKARTPGADLIAGSNNEEQAKIANSDTAIGMLSYAWINKDVKGVGIEDGKEIIEPTIENIQNRTYPISRNLSLVTDGEPGGIVREFIDYILSPEGQKLVAESGYVAVK